MEPKQSIEDFYRDKLNQTPDGLSRAMAHFRVFRLDDFVGPNAKPMPYSRKDYFKISLIVGKSRLHYAHPTIEFERNGLIFANPQVPYNYEHLEHSTGFFCIFTTAFLRDFNGIRLQDYPVFKPGGQPVYSPSDAQVAKLSAIYGRMFDEIESQYAYKNDVIRNLISEIIHEAQKSLLAISTHSIPHASARISSLFAELLERQFPIESLQHQICLRSPSEFARQMSLHVNHLNRALKETTGKTTSEIIAERVAQEAMVLLKHTNWNVAEIARCLAFKEPAHFNSFFKKKTGHTPTQFRAV